MLRAKRSSLVNNGRFIQELSLPRRASGESTGGDLEEDETDGKGVIAELEHGGEQNAYSDDDKENCAEEKSNNPSIPLTRPHEESTVSNHEVSRPLNVQNVPEVSCLYTTEDKSLGDVNVTTRRKKSCAYVAGGLVSVPQPKISLSSVAGRPVAVSKPISRHSPPVMAPSSNDPKQNSSQLQHQHNSQDQRNAKTGSSTYTSVLSEIQATTSRVSKQKGPIKTNRPSKLSFSTSQAQQQQQQYERSVNVEPSCSGTTAVPVSYRPNTTTTTGTVAMQDQHHKRIKSVSECQHQSRADTRTCATDSVTLAVSDRQPNSSQPKHRDDVTERNGMLTPLDSNQPKDAGSDLQRGCVDHMQQQITDAVALENTQSQHMKSSYGVHTGVVNTPVIQQDQLPAVHSSSHHRPQHHHNHHHRRHHHHYHHRHHQHQDQPVHFKKQQSATTEEWKGLTEEQRNTREDSGALMTSCRKRSSTVDVAGQLERQGFTAAASANTGSHTYTPSSTRHQQRHTGMDLQEELLHQQPKTMPHSQEVERRKDEQVVDKHSAVEDRMGLPQRTEQLTDEVVVMRSSRGPLRRLKKLKCLGGGGSSKIFQVLSESNELFALKEVYMRHLDPIIQQSFLKEVQLLKQLQEKQEIIRLYDYSWDKEAHILYILLECADMDLNSLIKKGYLQRAVNPALAVWQLWNEMLRIVKVIHDEGIIHNDLKPENFVCKGCNLYLIDFGISSRIEAEHTSIERDVRCGTVNYMAPETIEATGENDLYKVGKPSDIWSLGCILYQMVYRKTPFDHIKNKMKKWQAIVNCSTSIAYPQVPSSYTKLVEITKKCLTKNPKARPSVDDLLSFSSPENFSLP